MSYLYRVFLAESYIFQKNKTVRWTLVAAILILSYLLREAAGLRYGNIDPHYFISQLFLGVIIIVIFFPILVGAVTGMKDFEWETWSHKLIYVDKLKITLTKVFVILASCIIITSIAFIAGFLIDFNATRNTPLSLSVFSQYLLTIYICFFWGTFSFLISLLSKNLTLSVIIPFGYVFLEPLLYPFMNQQFLSLLPVWNQRSFLIEVFPPNTGILIIPQFNYSDPFLAFLLYSVYFICMLGILYLVVNKKEFK